MKNKFMSRAIELSMESVNNGTGPFGAVIVKNEKIIAEGYSNFGNIFNPIVEFLPLNEYNNVLKHTSIDVFYSIRQQAIGNILALLWFGTKVYLNKDNSFYLFLKRYKFNVFSFEEDFTSLLVALYFLLTLIFLLGTKLISLILI